MKFFEALVLIMAVGVIFLTALLFMGKGFDGQEKFECYQWQNQSKNYDNFYLTKWQKEQCDHWSIQIDAPVQ